MKEDRGRNEKEPELEESQDNNVKGVVDGPNDMKIKMSPRHNIVLSFSSTIFTFAP